MSERERWALPWPPDADPPEPYEPQQMLWIGSCERCGGRGITRLDIDGADPDDWYTCERCDGTGLADAGHPERRRLRDT